jgi:NAD(P)-dependent dehydrogenase (short-subunit alcohol dehydrogenase family)
MLKEEANLKSLEELFSLRGKVAVITGGTGTLGGTMARGLAAAGARVAILGRDEARGREVVRGIEEAGSEGLLLRGNVLDQDEVGLARDELLGRWGKIDILVNAAGGGAPGSVTTPQTSFFELPRTGLEASIDLNLLGTLLPTQILGAPMVERGSGCIVNISSMTAQRPLTNVVAYGASKAAVENFTRWLAVEVARRYGAGIRVNCIAPGFYLALQNRSMLLHDDGSLTPRGQTVIDHTPFGRFGDPEELIGPLIWLCSSGASFVTGIVVHVDGGFSAYSGV